MRLPGRRRPARGAAGVLLTGLVICGAAPANARPTDTGTQPRLSAALAGALARLPADGTVRVIVTLRAPADLGSLPTGGRAARLRAVIHRLKADADGSQTALRARLRVLGAQGDVSEETPLWVTNAVAVTASARAVRELATRPDVASVVPDAITVQPVAAAAEPNIARVGAPDLWAAGQTGQGVVVATLDSGVDLANPDLAARWRGGSNGWFDPYGEHPIDPVDLSGHGTATMGAIVGGEDAGTSYGMAPGATWIAARIFDDRGAASATAIHQAFQWLLDPDGDPSTADAPQVVNGSWVLGAGPSCDLTFQPDVQALRAAGIVPVFAAGNFGPNASTSASPANYPESLSVGAVDGSDTVWAYTSAGPSTCGGRDRVFPDLVAPGVSVLSADRYDGYTYLTGTSIAAPHVAGALALLLGAHPGQAAATQEAALAATATDLGATGPDDRYGQGRLDVAAANAWASALPDFSVTVTPTSATTSAGGSASFEVSVAPVNGFDAATTLTLGGLAPTSGSWSFQPSAVGPGAWSSTLTVTPSGGLAPGTYPLSVAASGGALARSAPLTLTVAPTADFTLSASSSTVTVKRGRTARYGIVVSSVAGFTGKVTLSPGDLPVGTTPAWTRKRVFVPGSATWRLKTSSSTVRGTYAIDMTGVSGGLTHRITLTLVVR